MLSFAYYPTREFSTAEARRRNEGAEVTQRILPFLSPLSIHGEGGRGVRRLVEKPRSPLHRRRHLQMFIRQLRRLPSPRRPFYIPFLDQKRLIHFFNGLRFFTNGGSHRGKANRSSFEFFDDGAQDPVVHVVQP